jgi:hypothetical protein
MPTSAHVIALVKKLVKLLPMSIEHNKDNFLSILLFPYSRLGINECCNAIRYRVLHFNS